MRNEPNTLMASGQISERLAILLLAAFPMLLLGVNSDWNYSASGAIDPWLYLGYSRNFTQYISEFFPETYYATRLGFIIPGLISYSIFPPLIANSVLHLFFYYLSIFSIYYVVRIFFGTTSATLTVLLMAGFPCFQHSVGGDNPDGAGLAYFALSIALTIKSMQSYNPRLWLCLTGMASGAMVHSHLFLLGYLFVCPVLYFFIRPYFFFESSKKRCFDISIYTATGFIFLTIIFGLFNYTCGGLFLFFMPSFQFARSFVTNPNPWKAETYGWLASATWLFVACIALFSSVYILFRCRYRSKSNREPAAICFAALHITLSSLMIAWEIKGTPVLQYKYYASYLIPSSFVIISILFSMLYAPEEENASRSSFWIPCGLACILLFANSDWFYRIGERYGINVCGPDQLWLVFSVATAAILGTQFLRINFRFRIALTLVGLIAIIFLCYSPRGESGRSSYERIISSCDAIEAHLAGRKPRFWYDEQETMGNEFRSMASVYLWGWSLINESFPALNSKLHGHARHRFFGGEVLVLPSAKEGAPERAITELIKLGYAGRLIRTFSVSGGLESYNVSLIEILFGEPLAISFDQDAKIFSCGKQGAKDVAPEVTNCWQVMPGETESRLTFSNGQANYMTHTDEGSCAFRLGPFRSLVDGEIGFHISYKETTGRIIFGVLDQAGKEWMVKADSEGKNADIKTQRVCFKPQKGDFFWLGIGNNRKKYKGPSHITIQGISCFSKVSPTDNVDGQTDRKRE